MHVVIEYISAGIIICMILGFAGQYAATMSADKINLIERNATLGKADRVIDMLLLSPGTPANWGQSLDFPQAVGFAFEGAIRQYDLDIDKVLRLSRDSPNYISPGRLRDLMGLSSVYYITLRIRPFFNMTVTKLSDSSFSVTVLNQWSIPVSNVNVTGAYTDVPVSQIDSAVLSRFLDGSLENADYAWSLTDALGRCNITFAGAPIRSTLILCGNQLNVKSVVTWPSQSTFLVGSIESSMGSVSGYNTETVYRNVEIEGLNYIARFTLWS